ncbi:hypothetical protein [Streptomyces sp. NPDC056634]|uniref:hypothetical protein n=1 Tax=Streptomyces sp. NPDC056634 TaxID=3345885 RepID=UPI0036883891
MRGATEETDASTAGLREHVTQEIGLIAKPRRGLLRLIDPRRGSRPARKVRRT